MLQGTADKKEYARIPVPYADLKNTAKWYKKTIAAYGWYEKKVAIINEEAERYHNEHVDEEYTPTYEETDNSSKATQQGQKPAQTNNSNTTDAQQNAQDTSSAQQTVTPTLADGEEYCTFHTQGEFILEDSFYKIKAKIDGYQQIGTLMFEKEQADGMKCFAKLMAAAKTESKSLTCVCTRVGGVFTYVRTK